MVPPEYAKRNENLMRRHASVVAVSQSSELLRHGTGDELHLPLFYDFIFLRLNVRTQNDAREKKKRSKMEFKWNKN